MKILFCGGGSLGPVTPLLAVLRQMRTQNRHATFAWVGTADGPEAGLVEAEGIPFHALPVAKLPRYLSLELLKFPFKYIAAKKAAHALVHQIHPDLVVTAGGFSGVPVIQEATKHEVPCAMHQLDYVPGLSNKMVASLCRSVTTSFEYETGPFGATVPSTQAPTPCRFVGVEMPSVDQAKQFFGIDAARKVILITGGGTGAQAINEAVASILEELLIDADVIHSTGVGKMGSAAHRKGYHPYELLNEHEMRSAYVAADIVISRAGLGALSELAALKKASIVIPIPGSQQEANAKAIQEGIVWLHQSEKDFASTLVESARMLLRDTEKQHALGEKLHELLPTDNGAALAKKWLKLF